jgi:hypothetical protein
MSENNRFQMLAYAGAVIDFDWWGRVVFDLAGMRLDAKLPALREHDRGRVVGVIDRTEKQPAILKAEGYFAGTTDGREVEALIHEGFPFQASIGVFPDTVEEIKEGAQAAVNGSVFKGPGIVVRQAHIREISFCVLGADSQTSVAALAASAGGLVENDAPADFVAGIDHFLRRGKPVRLAIQAAAQAWPGLFKAYRAELPDPEGYEEYFGLAELPGGFAGKVREFMLKGLDRKAAIVQAAHDFPDLRQQFVDRANPD